MSRRRKKVHHQKNQFSVTYLFFTVITLADVTAGRHGAAKDGIPTGI